MELIDKCENTKIDYTTVSLESFEQLENLHDGTLLRGIYEYGFEEPSKIQSISLPALCDGKDMIAQANSGSGKTGAFCIGTLAVIDPTLCYPQAIIIANTHELTTQTYNVIKDISGPMNIKIGLCIGHSRNDQHTDIKDICIVDTIADAIKNHILVCTPGKLVGLINKSPKNNNFILNKIKILVLDEADKLLGQNFIEQTKHIIQNIPSKTQICLFSATYTHETRELTKLFLKKDRVEILVKQEKVKVDIIQNYIVNAGFEKHKCETLIDLYKTLDICQIVIFVNTIKSACILKEYLNNQEFSPEVIHAQMTSTERNEVLKKFRKAQTRILIATDLISRGIDVQQVGVVINFDIPRNPIDYIHRVGRSGRFGKQGIAINIICNNNYDEYNIDAIQKEYKIKMITAPNFTSMKELLRKNNDY
jgi:superfamily II DNA/RNA helicase